MARRALWTRSSLFTNGFSLPQGHSHQEGEQRNENFLAVATLGLMDDGASDWHSHCAFAPEKGPTTYGWKRAAAICPRLVPNTPVLWLAGYGNLAEQIERRIETPRVG